MKNEKAIIIKGLSKEYYKKDSSQSGFFDKFKPNKSGQSFYALKDINLEINKGEVIGIIGPNGAGNSTLLKILAEVTPPTSGSVEIFGKVASILETGIGFQPELSGYENIFLSGKLYGLSNEKISQSIDKIIEVFGFKDFVNTPVKYYSSGMYMRLAFAIIINIEASIYLFDEIMSVGDIEFQDFVKSHIWHMKKQGKTVLIVTHNINLVLDITDNMLLIERGMLSIFDTPYKVSHQYLNKSRNSNKRGYISTINNEIEFIIEEIKVYNPERLNNIVLAEYNIRISVRYKVFFSEPFSIAFVLKNPDNKVFSTYFFEQETALNGQEFNTSIEFLEHTFKITNITIDIVILQKNKVAIYAENVYNFDIHTMDKSTNQLVDIGFININAKKTNVKVSN